MPPQRPFGTDSLKTCRSLQPNSVCTCVLCKPLLGPDVSRFNTQPARSSDVRLRLSTRAAVRAFLRTFYKRYAGQPAGRFALPQPVPADYGPRLRELRLRLRISQADLAELVGAANKSVVYQWESGKRVPSPVFWTRVLAITQHSQFGARSAKIDACARSSVG